MPRDGTQHPLAGQRALVTGGGSGIGLASAAALARDGASVTLMGRDKERLERAAAVLRDEATPEAAIAVAAGDVANEDDVQRAIEVAAGREGTLQVALANAGMGGLAPLAHTELEDWDRVMRVNLNGTFLTFKHAGAAIASSGGGALCAISSIAGLRTHRFMAAYCTSKAGIDMLVRNTADELGVANVRCNSVCPGLVETELAQALFDDETVFQDYLACMPLRRPGKVDDIASAVRFLCGPESAWLTGVNLPVDGGHHLRRGPDVERFARLVYGDDAVTGGSSGS